MFGLIDFDPTAMSDEELMNKQVALHSRLAWATRFSGSDTVQRLQEFLSAIEFERAERAFVANLRMIDKLMPQVIETDPDLAAGNPVPEEPEAKPAAPQRPRVTITRTTKPAPNSDF